LFNAPVHPDVWLFSEASSQRAACVKVSSVPSPIGVSSISIREVRPRSKMDVVTKPRIWAGWYEVSVGARLDPAARRREVRRRLIRSLRAHAGAYLPQRLAEICHSVHVRERALVVREQAKRWGSCDRRGVLRINWRIIQAPMPLIDYVLVHELAHLGHRSHDRKFWESVGQWLPDYDQRRVRLRELGPSLVW
jgi:predicted metal-dependent hydrolase